MIVTLAMYEWDASSVGTGCSVVDLPPDFRVGVLSASDVSEASMSSQAEKAQQFRALHLGNHPLILPNAWDVPSARVFEDAGFPAVATSSAGLMVSLGYRDGQEMPRRELISAIERIATRLSVPLSADVVAGYGRGPREISATVKSVILAGAVGINIEDADHARGQLFPVRVQVGRLKMLRNLTESLQIPFVINARTDALRFAPGDAAKRLQEAIDRMIAYRDAGADCVYPMGLFDAASISTVVNTVACPVNVMVRAGLPSVPELERLGVRRVSFGPYASYATMGLLRRISTEIRERGTFGALLEGAITHDELNRLAVPRQSGSGAPNS